MLNRLNPLAQDPIFPYSSISLLDRIELERERKCTNNLPIVFLVNSIDIVNEYKSFYETFN